MSCNLLSGGARHISTLSAPVGRKLRNGLLAVAVASSCLVAAGSASADIGSTHVDNVNPLSVIVENDGKNYTGLAGPQTTLVADFSYLFDTEGSGKVRSFGVWLKIRAEETEWIQFKEFKYRKEFPIGSRPEVASGTGKLALPYLKYANLLTSYCNRQAQMLRNQGLSNQQIFSQHRPLKAAIHTAHEFDTSGRAGSDASGIGGDWNNLAKINVICKGEPVNLDPAAPPITSAQLNVKPIVKKVADGSCDMELSGYITSKDPNTQVKFVYVDDKGKKSDLKTITTDGNGEATFKHIYPAASGKNSGSIRMVGQGPAFFSNWSGYETDCHKTAGEKVSVLPPKAVAVEAYPTADKVSYRGLVCPAAVKIWGVLLGRGDVSGFVTIHADGKLKVQEQFEAEDGKDIVVQGEHALSWEGNQTGKQSVHYRMDIINAAGSQIVETMEKSLSFECKKPQVSDAVQGGPGGIASNDNLPKSVTLSVSTLGLKKLPGWICPEKARLHGNVLSDDQPLSGKAILYVGDTFIKEYDVELEAHWGHNYDADYELSWNAATQTEQTLDFTLKFANEHNYVVKTVKKTESFACQKVAVNPAVAGGPGGKAPELAGPQASQQNAPVAAGQLAVGPALAIMAPKGRVRSGQIRLTGGPANATYELTFYRKVYSSYQKVAVAGLPKQMTGLTASFDLAALDGTRQWRLEVCPVMGGQGTCKTSDFRVPLIAAKKQKAPAQATPFVIVPGAIPQQ